MHIQEIRSIAIVIMRELREQGYLPPFPIEENYAQKIAQQNRPAPEHKNGNSCGEESEASRSDCLRCTEKAGEISRLKWQLEEALGKNAPAVKQVIRCLHDPQRINYVGPLNVQVGNICDALVFGNRIAARRYAERHGLFGNLFLFEDFQG